MDESEYQEAAGRRNGLVERLAAIKRGDVDATPEEIRHIESEIARLGDALSQDIEESDD
jgi:hypothetical protein